MEVYVIKHKSPSCGLFTHEAKLSFIPLGHPPKKMFIIQKEKNLEVNSL